MWIQREISPNIAARTKLAPVLLLTGCRQTGKTSLLRRLFPQAAYVSLDLPRNAEMAEDDGLAFLEQYPSPVIIDEIQYAPTLLRYIKHVVDERHHHHGKHQPGQFLITGSQKFALMQGASESLAGRVAIVELHPLSIAELQRSLDTPNTPEQLASYIWQGGYPNLHASSIPPEMFFSDYVATYIERDVRQALNVRSLRDFDRMLRLLAARCGQLLSLSNLAAEVGVAVNTIKSWLSVLQASNIVVLLEPYYRNLGKRLIKTPKVYFADTGLACYLAGMDSATALLRSSLLGAMFENHILTQLLRWEYNRGKRPEVYFYRDQQGKEVDFVIPKGDGMHLLEAKWGATPSPRQRGFEEVETRVSSDHILTKSVVTPYPGTRQSSVKGVRFVDSINFDWLQ